MRASAATLFVAFALAGCGGGDDETEPANTSGWTPYAPVTDGPASQRLSERCESAASDLTTPLTNGLEPEGLQLTSAFVVKSSDHDSVYFVSAEVEGPGYENSGDVATWASTSRYGGDLLYAVDELANELSTLRDGREVARLSTGDDGVQLSRDCVGPVGG